MNITFIGSGNVATHLALALHSRGHIIRQIWSRKMDHAVLLASRVLAEPVDDIHRISPNTDIVIIAVPDDALFDIAIDLEHTSALVLHTSGSTTIDVLRSTSAHYGVIWSPQSFVRDMALDYEQLPFCIEGNGVESEERIAKFIGTLSPHIYHTSLTQRQYLHLAAVLENNFANGLHAMAQAICKEHDMPFEILHPIITTTAKRALYADVRYSLTGPAVRHDTHTLRTHQQLLTDKPQYLDVYKAMTLLLQSVMNDWNRS